MLQGANSTTLIGVLLIAIGIALMYIGLNGWTGAPTLKLPTVPTGDGASGGGGGGFG